MKWSWDQGRLQYFQFDNLKAIAHTLAVFDNVQIDATYEQAFRQQLEDNTGLGFKPETYTIKRNYKRVFECALLATFVGKRFERLECSDICREMAKNDSSLDYVDEYFSVYIPRFRYPFPAFSNYVQATNIVYPFCVILKYLIARREHDFEPQISVDDTLNILIANNCTGYEDPEYFLRLIPKISNIDDDEKRQVREMLIFMSQMSIFKMFQDRLYLDVTWSEATVTFLRKISQPFGKIPLEDRTKEFFNQTRLGTAIHVPSITSSTFSPNDIEFVEGKRTRVEHLKIERSPLLRKFYMEHNPRPICKMCNTHMDQRYPWTSYLLEIHHLLPLSSTLEISAKGTSLKDVIGLCPSCHRGLHSYYKHWLSNHNRSDFASKEEVESVYQEAKERIQL